MGGSYCVYRHTTPNGKVYFGITCQAPEARFSNGYGYKDNEHFYRAILKYGWENITHDILYKGLSQDDASSKEIELISKYDTINPLYGYNKTSGGYAGYTYSEDTRRKKSECAKRMWERPEYRADFTKRMSGKNNPMCKKVFTEEDRKTFSEMGKRSKGRPMSEETKKKLSEARKKQGNFRQGTRHTEETKRKISESNKGKTASVSMEARQKISKALTGITRSEETRRKMSIAQKGVSRQRPDVSKAVEQVDKTTGSVIARYCSMTAASEETGANKTGISRCCRGDIRSSNGYVWRYADKHNRRRETS